MFSAEKVERFERDGFLPGPRVLDENQIETIRAEIMRVIEDRDRRDIPQPVRVTDLSGGETSIWQIVNIWQASTPCAELVHHPEMTRIVAQLLGEPESVRVWHDQVQYKPAQKGGVNWWHQDSIYWPPIREKSLQVTAWIALDDADPDNGCMSMVPGSHRWGEQMEYLHRVRDEKGLGSFLELDRDAQGGPISPVPCPVKAGHVHFHHALTWHGSQANTSGRPRRALAVHYMSGATTHDRSAGSHPMSEFITAADDEPIAGEAFPVVWPV